MEKKWVYQTLLVGISGARQWIDILLRHPMHIKCDTLKVEWGPCKINLRGGSNMPCLSFISTHSLADNLILNNGFILVANVYWGSLLIHKSILTFPIRHLMLLWWTEVTSNDIFWYSVWCGITILMRTRRHNLLR